MTSYQSSTLSSCSSALTNISNGAMGMRVDFLKRRWVLELTWAVKLLYPLHKGTTQHDRKPMLHYVPNLRRFNQGTVEYCALVSMQMVQAARGGTFNTSAPVPASVANQGLPRTSVLAMFENNGFVPLAPGQPNHVFTAHDILNALKRFGPFIACGQIRVTRAAYGHAVVVFGIDTARSLVLLKDPNATLPQLGATDPFTDATVVTLNLFNQVLARISLGDRAVVGKPSTGTQLSIESNPTYVMGDVRGMINPAVGRVFERGKRGGRAREI